MDKLAAKIRRELNTYQAEVTTRLQQLQTEGLLSQTEFKKMVIDAQITGNAVLDGLALQQQYTEEATEIYVYSLFDRYKSKLESQIRSIEKQQKSSNILIHGKSIPLYFEDKEGELIVPYNDMEQQIAQDFLEYALEIPVKDVTIIIGNRDREIRLTTEKPMFIVSRSSYNRKVENNKKKIQLIYQNFGSSISQLVNAKYSEKSKNQEILELLKNMKLKFGKRKEYKTKSFWDFFSMEKKSNG